MTTMQVFSSGAGRQSIAALVLAAEGRIPFRTHLFCNVGDRAENPDTLAYWRDVAVPFAKRHGLEAIELRRYHRLTCRECRRCLHHCRCEPSEPEAA